jgi:hypothetical protein
METATAINAKPRHASISECYHIKPHEMKHEPRFRELVTAIESGDAALIPLKARYNDLDRILRERGKEIVTLGTARPQKRKSDPLFGLNELVVAETMRKFRITDHEVEHDLRFAFLVRGVVMGITFASDLRRRISAVERLLEKLDSKSAAATAATIQENK